MCQPYFLLKNCAAEVAKIISEDMHARLPLCLERGSNLDESFAVYKGDGFVFGPGASSFGNVGCGDEKGMGRFFMDERAK